MKLTLTKGMIMELRVTKVNKIFCNGKHNGFPGIATFKNAVYVSFRTGSSHLSHDGDIIVLRSLDLSKWEIVATLHNDAGDLRDSTMIVKNDQLWVYAGLVQKEKKMQTVAYCSADGCHFSEQVICVELPDYWLWDMTLFHDSIYATAYTQSGGVYKASFFRSEDGINFSSLCHAPVPCINEISIDFSSDGTMYALLRNDTYGSIPFLAKSLPPYNEFFSCEILPIRLHGPRIKRMKNACVIIGRNWNEPGRRNLRTDIHILEDNKVLKFVSTLPSGGDTSYASWLDKEPGKAVVVYYSAHEHCMDYGFDQDMENDPAAPEHHCGADIYLAHVDYRED